MKTTLFVLLLIFSTAVVGNAQKASETIYYFGKCRSYSIQFVFTNGYISGSSIEVINNKNLQKNVYLPVNIPVNEKEGWKFILSTELSLDSNDDYFMIEGLQEYTDIPPTAVSLKYHYQDKEFTFDLKKI